MCLIAGTGNSGGRAPVYNWQCNGGTTQMWYFEGSQIKNLFWGHGWCLMADYLRAGLLMMHRCSVKHFIDEWFALLGSNQIINPRQRGGVMDAATTKNGSIVYMRNGNHGGFNQRWTIGGKLKISGRWVPLHGVVGKRIYTEKVGVTKGTEATKSSQWSKSVSTSVSAGVGCAFGSVSSTLSTEVSKSMSSSHSRQWSQTKEMDFSMEISPKDGAYLWQWQYLMDTEYVESFWVKTKDYAVTAGIPEIPKCAPGWCLKKNMPRYQKCYPGGELR